MSAHDEHPFRDRDQELEHLGRQLHDIKEALREIAARVSQIERHVKRAFGIARLPGQVSAPRPKSADTAQDRPTISPEQVRPIFDELVQSWKDGSPERAESRLQAMSIADIKLMAHELGVSFSSKPSRKSLVAGITGRVNESMMLSRNSNLTISRSEQMKTELSASELDTPDSGSKGGGND
jgi:hypothetical protein